MEKYRPPFIATDKILNLISEISELLGKIYISARDINPKLRRENRIKTIHSSLAIENNTLSLEQVTAVIDGKRILGAPKEIQEVKNAFEAYDHILDLDPYKVSDLLKAHEMMMSSLVPEAGRFRSGSVGVFAGNTLIHLAPPADSVASHIANLLDWVKTSSLNMLVKSCIFHYEFELIHPFQDGNGRTGRMWQTLLLSKYRQLFVYLPIETLIKERQKGYYECLQKSDAKGNSDVFVEFMLQVIFDALSEIGQKSKLPDKVEQLLNVMTDEPESAKTILKKLGLTRLQTLRKNYLNPALDLKVVAMTEPNSPNSRNQKYYRR